MTIFERPVRTELSDEPIQFAYTDTFSDFRDRMIGHQYFQCIIIDEGSRWFFTDWGTHANFKKVLIEDTVLQDIYESETPNDQQYTYGQVYFNERGVFHVFFDRSLSHIPTLEKKCILNFFTTNQEFLQRGNVSVNINGQSKYIYDSVECKMHEMVGFDENENTLWVEVLLNDSDS